MRIAVVSTPFVALPPRGYGGTELVVDGLARALAAMRHDVVVFATGDSRAPGLRAHFARPVWPPDARAELLHARFAAAEIAVGGFDVVHSHITSLVPFARSLGTPVVHTLHHVHDPVLARLYAAQPDVLRVAISARQAELHAPTPHAVVHHGLDPDLYPRAGRGGDRAFFLGRLAWVKGPEVAIEAARLARLGIDVAGARHREDDAPEDWDAQVLEPALRAPHVRWCPSANLPTKRRAFARARALLMPIRWEEPFGLVMIEAALAGCPVVAFPRGAAPEIIEEGVTGFLVRDVREMAEALRVAGGLDRRAIQARARERFSTRRMAEEYLRVYRRAIRATVHRAEQEGAWTTFTP